MMKYFYKLSEKDDSEFILNHEKSVNPKFAMCNAIYALQNTSAKVLLIYSDDDVKVEKKYNYDVLYERFKDKENIEFVIVYGKGHNANYSLDAVKYLETFASELQKGIPQTDDEKIGFKNFFDWDKMTRQDDEVWKIIKIF